MVELMERAFGLSADASSVLAGIFLIGLAGVLSSRSPFESEEVEEISRSERIRRARKLADEGLEGGRKKGSAAGKTDTALIRDARKGYALF